MIVRFLQLFSNRCFKKLEEKMKNGTLICQDLDDYIKRRLKTENN